ncbi:HAMP domain-containing histidine kinase [Fulvivirgaceae bacterium PWU5]|uniref:histidine kinase n=2 Tax=Dawidia cretensis TaxID=2782350 RepID=A0AAP2E0V1_9BACT|nr:HAMP domain-containing histidine kinase [Dawidia cretensis]
MSAPFETENTETGDDCRSQLEQLLQERDDELAKVNRRMEKFLYSASHDLRSPLTSIMGLTNLMRMETHEPMLLSYIGKIDESTARLEKIVRDLVGFTRISYQRPNSKKIDFTKLVWDVIDRHKAEPAFRSIRFDVQTDEAFPFFADYDRLEIILENIIANAIHFYDPAKTHSRIRITMVGEGQHVRMDILDNGIGIAAAHHHNIFNMFFKASERSRGAGLGLYIVKEAVDKLQGHVQVESEIGFGSLFRVVLPNDPKGRLISRKMQLGQ